MSSGKWRPFCLCLNVLTWDTPCRVTDDAGHNGNGNIFRVTGPLCGEFTGHGEFPAQRPVTRSCDVFFDLRPTKRLNKQPWGWWFETPSWSLWRQCNDTASHMLAVDMWLMWAWALSLLWHDAVTRILANGSAAFFESCTAIGWKTCDSVRSL